MLSRTSAQVAAGVAAFVAAHVVEAWAWHAWFDGAYRAWFTNSGRAVVFTCACIFITGAAVGRGAGTPLPAGLRVGVGAWFAMVAILLLGGDPGTIFPIVVVLGTAVLGAAALGGAFAGAAMRAK